MGLFGKKEDVYRIELIPLKPGLEFVVELLEEAIRDAGQELNDGIMLVRERGQVFALGRINQDVDVSCITIQMGHEECVIEFKKPVTSNTTEAVIVDIFISFLEKYVSRANPGAQPFNYIVTKGNSSRKLRSWSEVNKLVSNEDFISNARRKN